MPAYAGRKSNFPASLPIQLYHTCGGNSTPLCLRKVYPVVRRPGQVVPMGRRDIAPLPSPYDIANSDGRQKATLTLRLGLRTLSPPPCGRSKYHLSSPRAGATVPCHMKEDNHKTRWTPLSASGTCAARGEAEMRRRSFASKGRSRSDGEADRKGPRVAFCCSSEFVSPRRAGRHFKETATPFRRVGAPVWSVPGGRNGVDRPRSPGFQEISACFTTCFD